MKLTPGTHVTPRIVLQRPLGEGAMAAVWQAHHAGLDAEVAVKFLFTHAAKRNPRLFQRFRSEASVAAKIRSPYVVQMLDYGVTEDGRPFLVMEMLDGEPLDRLIARRGVLTPAEVTTVVRHVCKALAKAHAMGVVHRDIKPGNLYNVGGDELFVKVLDFGIAKRDVDGVEGLTLAGEVTGTPLYMSPEQLADSKDVDGRTDLWAVGVVAYQLLTGRLPFGGDSLADLYLEVTSGRFAPPTEGRADLSPELDGWFGRMLATDRDERFQTAEDAAAAFPLGTIGGSSVETQAPSPALAAPAVTGWDHSGTQSLGDGTLSGDTMSIDGPPALASPTPTQMMGVETAAALVVERPPAPVLASPPPPRPRRGSLGWVLAALVLATGGGAAVFVLTRPVPAAPAPSSDTNPRDTPDDADAGDSAAPVAVPPDTPDVSPDAAAPSASARDAAAPSASARDAAALTPPVARPPVVIVPSKPVAPTPAAPKPNCQGDNAYIVDAKGHLIPKPGCM